MRRLRCGLAILLCLVLDGAGMACERSAFRVVLDVGHSPQAPGARSARGIDEYRYNLALASVIETRLRAQGFFATTRMLTEGGREGLASRAAKANGLAADLLLSVHHDSVQDRLLEAWSVEGRAERYSDRFAGWSLFVSQAGARARESAVFARLLADRLLAERLPFTRHHAQAIAGERRRFLDPARGIYRYDELAVLKASAAPAVLMEAGIIVNRDEEAFLSGPDRQNRIAGAVAGAVEAYCASKDAGR